MLSIYEFRDDEPSTTPYPKEFAVDYVRGHAASGSGASPAD
jgi:hypothetical protein